jgi:hypothetical protein
MSERIPSLDMADAHVSRSGRLITAKREIHGMRKSPEYSSWVAMKTRCLNPNHRSYQDYGALGVTICAEWMQSFMAFYRAMGPRPGHNYSIDRIDNRRGYEPGNCRWATPKTQSRNRRRCFLMVNGVTKSLRQWASEAGIAKDTIRLRLVNGATPEQAILPPTPRGQRNKKLFEYRASAERAGITREAS